MKILISDAFDPSLPDRLKTFGQVTDDKSQVAEADVVLIRSKTKVNKEYIDNAPNLKLVIRGGVGLDNVDLEYAKEKGIVVHNTPAASSVAVAELAFALMIAVPNHIVKGHNGMAKGEWLKKECKRTELMGKTLGLIGIGRIASEVAKRAAAFGMKVIAFDKYVEKSDIAEMMSFDDMLSKADYISMHVPFTPETKDLISKESIAKMKDGVVIVNTGRGKCVNEADLVEALNSGKVANYATDVWFSDPPAADCPILTAPNTLMTPHIGASSKENLLRIGDIVVDIITNFNK
ncbi:hydroxyacid dehydrogenase [bacterium]|nr:hydroxyacid dehydrogenase [bacterium]